MGIQVIERFPRSVVAGIASLLCIIILAGCQTTGGRLTSSSDCSLFEGSSRSDNLVIASDHGRLDPLLQYVSTSPLVRIDCEGGATPGRGIGWERQNGGRRWVFSLLESSPDINVLGADTELRLQQNAGRYPDIDSLLIDGPASFSIYFNEAFTRPPQFLASPEFSLFPGPETNIVDISGQDGRDVLAVGGIDVLITRDPVVLDYARRRDEWQVSELPWDRVYVLGAPAMPAGAGTLPVFLSRSLASGAVRSKAREVAPNGWWEQIDSCGAIPVASVRGIPEDSGLLYDMEDPAARDLAERIVALVSMDNGVVELKQTFAGKTPVAQGVSRSQFEQSLVAGSSIGYVFYVERQTYHACSAASELINKASWLGLNSERKAFNFIPLVETRPHVIVRRGVNISVDGFGRLAF